MDCALESPAESVLLVFRVALDECGFSNRRQRR